MSPQDNSGWTPLHEASNHNFYDIVAHLLTHGAEINHRGGKECGGVTPLIDAASCGHVEIMQLLIEREANVLCKDDQVCSLRMRKQQFGFLTRSDTNWPVLSQKQARTLKLWI